MAQEKLTLLLEIYKDNPKALLKIEEYIENKLPKLLDSFIEREKRTRNFRISNGKIY